MAAVAGEPRPRQSRRSYFFDFLVVFLVVFLDDFLAAFFTAMARSPPFLFIKSKIIHDASQCIFVYIAHFVLDSQIKTRATNRAPAPRDGA